VRAIFWPGRNRASDVDQLRNTSVERNGGESSVRANQSVLTSGGRKDSDENRILYVEDDERLRRSFTRTLAGRGMGVDTASTRDEALHLLAQHDYPVIVTDLLLPEVDGVTLVHELRGVQPDASFIITTGCEVAYCAPGGLEDSIACFLKKPWSERELTSAVDSARESYRIRRSSRAPAYPSRYSVLVIANQPEAAWSRRMLDSSGLCDDIAYCPVSERAASLLRNQSFDAVFLDLSGRETAGLRELPELAGAGPNTALIVIVNEESADTPALRLGAQDLLIKSETDPELLKRRLQEAIDRKRQERRLVFLAHHDQLTQLTNRAAFAERLEHTVAASLRSGRRCALMFLDLNDFKTVNETHGHEAGDAVLCEVARRIQASIREDDCVARIGGDEFAVLVDFVEDPQICVRVANRILQIIAMPILLRDEANASVRAHVGVAMCPDSANSADALLRAADAAMCEAKAGNTGYHVHASTLPDNPPAKPDGKRNAKRAR
jgi:diguanylate cyclase (GGDEF)-like protein